MLVKRKSFLHHSQFFFSFLSLLLTLHYHLHRYRLSGQQNLNRAILKISQHSIVSVCHTNGWWKKNRKCLIFQFVSPSEFLFQIITMSHNLGTIDDFNTNYRFSHVWNHVWFPMVGLFRRNVWNTVWTTFYLRTLTFRNDSIAWTFYSLENVDTQKSSFFLN